MREMALLSERVQEGWERGTRRKTITYYCVCFDLRRLENQLVLQVENLATFPHGLVLEKGGWVFPHASFFQPSSGKSN